MAVVLSIVIPGQIVGKPSISPSFFYNYEINACCCRPPGAILAIFGARPNIRRRWLRADVHSDCIYVDWRFGWLPNIGWCKYLELSGLADCLLMQMQWKICVGATLQNILFAMQAEFDDTPKLISQASGMVNFCQVINLHVTLLVYFI